MHKTKEEILSLSALEYMQWSEYFNIFPFTQEREDMRAAKIIAMVFNAASTFALRKKGTSPKILQPKDFYPEYIKEQKQTTFTPKSIEQQRLEFAFFRERLRAKSPKSVTRKTI